MSTLSRYNPRWSWMEAVSSQDVRRRHEDTVASDRPVRPCPTSDGAVMQGRLRCTAGEENATPRMLLRPYPSSRRRAAVPSSLPHRRRSRHRRQAQEGGATSLSSFDEPAQPIAHSLRARLRSSSSPIGLTIVGLCRLNSCRLLSDLRSRTERFGADGDGDVDLSIAWERQRPMFVLRPCLFPCFI